MSGGSAPFVYVANSGPLFSGNPEPQTLSQYEVRPGGLLAPLDPPTVASAGTPYDVAVSPDGGSVYVANFVCGAFGQPYSCISQYDVRAGGALSPKTPATQPNISSTAESVAVSPDGRSVYVAAGGVYQFDVGPGGLLSPKHPAFCFHPVQPTRRLRRDGPDGQKRLRGDLLRLRRGGRRLPIRRRPRAVRSAAKSLAGCQRGRELRRRRLAGEHRGWTPSTSTGQLDAVSQGDDRRRRRPRRHEDPVLRRRRRPNRAAVDVSPPVLAGSVYVTELRPAHDRPRQSYDGRAGRSRRRPRPRLLQARGPTTWR